MAKKNVEMARYYGSEVLRNKSLQKGINFELKKLTPAVGSEALDQLSTNIRPNKKYRTDRKDLDGRSIQLFEKVDDNLTDPKKDQKISTRSDQICMATSTNIWIWGNIGAIPYCPWIS